MNPSEKSGNGQAEVVVITGASGGVGRATVREFARHGAHIGLIARGIDGLEGARAEVEALGGKAIIIACDVSDADAVEKAASEVEQRLGPITIWINDAMVSVFSPFKLMEAKEFKRVTEVTYLGYVYGTMAALRRMLPRNRGVVIQVGSALAYRSIPLQSAYCGAKHAIAGFTQSLRCELLHDESHVQVRMVELPAVNTTQFEWSKSKMPRKPQPVPPIYQPEVIARAIYWAAHHAKRDLEIGGSTAMVLFLNKFLPGLGDRYLARTGYRSQMTGEPDDHNRPNDLWEPVPGDHGAHGPFGARAREHSYQVWLDEHRGGLAGIGAALIGAGAAIALSKRLRRNRDKRELEKDIKFYEEARKVSYG